MKSITNMTTYLRLAFAMYPMMEYIKIENQKLGEILALTHRFNRLSIINNTIHSDFILFIHK